MENSILAPEIFICEEEDWSKKAFQIRFTQQFLDILNFFEKNLAETKLFFSVDLFNLLWANHPWLNSWHTLLIKSPNYGELYNDLKRISYIHDGKTAPCTINPNICIVENEEIEEKWLMLVHLLVNNSDNKSIITGFNNSYGDGHTLTICECHDSEKCGIFRIDSYGGFLTELRELACKLNAGEKTSIKNAFRVWRKEPNTEQRKILVNFGLAFKHRKAGHGRIYYIKDPSQRVDVSCTPGSDNAGINIALDLINLIDRLKQNP